MICLLFFSSKCHVNKLKIEKSLKHFANIFVICSHLFKLQNTKKITHENIYKSSDSHLLLYPGRLQSFNRKMRQVNIR